MDTFTKFEVCSSCCDGVVYTLKDHHRLCLTTVIKSQLSFTSRGIVHQGQVK